MAKHHKKFFSILWAGVLTAVFVSCGGSVRSGRDSRGGIEVVATLFPLYDFARQIGGDRAEVRLLVPPGGEAHSFEPSPQDVARVSRARIFVFTGGVLDPWAQDFLSGIQNPNLIVVEAGKDIPLAGRRRGKDEDDDGDSDTRGPGGQDPHIWLNLLYAEKMVETITEAFIAARPEDRDYFRANCRAYADKLADLDARIFEAVKGFRHKTILCGGHFAFGYFAERYGLDYMSPYPGFTPNAEPTPRRVLRLSSALKTLGLSYIFHEELVDPRIAEIISRETGAKLLLLHGAHSVAKKDLDEGLTFLDIMEQNLVNLRTALE
jgi:zinc transport system substrate-binding protein